MENKLKIAIMHDFLIKIGGAEKVVLAFHEIFPDAPIYTPLYDEAGTEHMFKDCKIISSSLDKHPSFFKRKPKLFLPFYSRAIEEFDFSEYDVVLSSSNSFAHGILTPPKIFHISYCHSPIRYVWDYTNEYLKENRIGFGLKGLLIRRVLHETRIWDKISSSRVDKWIANSQNVRNRIKHYYRMDADVIYPFVDLSKSTLNENLPDDYYIIVSRLEPFKKIDLAIKAFNELGKHLVILGTGSQADYLKSIAGKNIEFLGWQSDKSVCEYMKNAQALLFPGEDDLGMTPVESMACGRPVIAFKKGGALETVIDGKTGLFFEEQTKESLTEAINRFESQKLNFSPRACRDQAEKFSKDIFKEKIKSAVENGYKEYISNNY